MARDKKLVTGSVKKASSKAATEKPTATPPPSPVARKSKVTAKVVSPASELETEAESLGFPPWIMDEVYQKAHEDGISIADLCEHMGYSPGYLFHLKAFPHKCKKLSNETIQKFAAYLERDVISVKVAAGIITPEQMFNITNERKRRIELVRCVRLIAEDPEWSVFVMRPVQKMDDAMLMMLVFAYQKATNLKLMPITSPRDALFEAMNSMMKRQQSVIDELQKKKATE